MSASAFVGKNILIWKVQEHQNRSWMIKQRKKVKCSFFGFIILTLIIFANHIIFNHFWIDLGVIVIAHCNSVTNRALTGVAGVKKERLYSVFTTLINV